MDLDSWDGDIKHSDEPFEDRCDVDRNTQNDAADPSGDLTLNVIDSMEQGVLVWSADGTCIMHNQRIFDVLELRSGDIYKGRSRRDFLEVAVKRGEITEEKANQTEHRFRSSAPFHFDRQMPSGRVVATNARPMSAGGFVVTFTDVTASRRNEVELAEAMHRAEESETRAKQALVGEQVRQREMSLLSELDEWLQSCQSLAELFQVVTAFMERILPQTSGELYVYSNSRDVLDGACHWNGSGAIDHIQPDACWSLRRGRPYEFGAGTISMPCTHVEHQMPSVADQHYVCLPIIAHGDTVGLLHIKFNEDLDAPSTGQQSLDPRRFAIQCAEHISLAIANVRLRDELRDQSTKDVLTGLFNRRYFLEILRGELGRSQRTDSEVAIISFDADKFKTFNDNHGHDAGDVVLREIAECMRATFSKDDVLCRFGGEEFCVLMPETSLESAFEIAEKFRKAVEAVSIIYSGGKLPRVTISGGVAAFPANAKSPQDLLAAADQALYKAKANGRNKMCKYIDSSEGNVD
ncbi:MAG: diguanylate cyclase [Hyphomicrobiaceae bacterium]